MRTPRSIDAMALLSMHIGEFLPCKLYIIDLEYVAGGVAVIGQNVQGQKFHRTVANRAEASALLEAR